MSYREELIQVAAVAVAALEDQYVNTDGIHPGNARVQAISAIMDERINQVNKWGDQKHEPMKWFTILGEEVGEVANAILEKDFT